MTIATGISSTSFTVAPGDVARFAVDAIIRNHSFDFSDDSGDVEVTDVTGVTITHTAPVEPFSGFTPTSSDFVDLIGFAEDGGLPYRFI